MARGPHHFSPRPNRAHDIPWLEWGPEAFERARAEDKPVLLSISATWCHWCHVMDETTYSDQRVIERIASRFIPVRVDNDVRPDVNARYNMGGWPTTAFLDADGEVLGGLTYVPPDRMLAVLDRVNEAWLIDRENIAARIAEVQRQRAEREESNASTGALSLDIYEQVLRTLDEAYDSEHGGFGPVGGGGPKFPQPDALRLLLYRARRDEDGEALERVRLTLRAMAAGGVYDHVEGGFFRYATAADWSEPHFEKMADDHGGLLLALAELALTSPDDRSEAEEVVERTIDYLDRTLLTAGGGFYGSQDADEDYYAQPLEGRDRLDPPAVDERVYAAWTAALARGYLACGVAFERRAWLERGRTAVDFLWARLRGGQAGMYRYWDGEAHLLGLLADQVETTLALLDAYEVLGDSTYRERAQQLARILETHWRDPGRGFRDTAEGHDDAGLLGVPMYPLSENAGAAEAFLRLGRLTHDERYLAVAQDTLEASAEGYARHGTRAARYALAVARLLTPEPEIEVITAAEASSDAARRAAALHATALRLPLAGRTVQLLHPIDDASWFAELGLPYDREGVAYVCVGRTCSAPVDHPDDLPRAVELALEEPAWAF